MLWRRRTRVDGDVGVGSQRDRPRLLLGSWRGVSSCGRWVIEGGRKETNPMVKAPSKMKSMTAAPIPHDVAMEVLF